MDHQVSTGQGGHVPHQPNGWRAVHVDAAHMESGANVVGRSAAVDAAVFCAHTADVHVADDAVILGDVVAHTVTNRLRQVPSVQVPRHLGKGVPRGRAAQGNRTARLVDGFGERVLQDWGFVCLRRVREREIVQNSPQYLSASKGCTRLPME